MSLRRIAVLGRCYNLAPQNRSNESKAEAQSLANGDDHSHFCSLHEECTRVTKPLHYVCTSKYLVSATAK